MNGTRIKSVVMAFLVFGGGVLHAADDMRTDGYRNGRFWGRMSADARIIYVVGLTDGLDRGIREGVNVADSWCSAYKGLSKTGAVSLIQGIANSGFLTDVTFSDVVKAIDKFYAEPENVLIPIVGAQHIVVMGFVGESDQAMRDETLALRQSSMRGKSAK
jgi:hypothetical protein